MEVWEEPVRGGYPPLWMMALSGQQRNDLWEKYAPIPPLGHLTGCRPTEFGFGESRSVMPASPWLQSPQGRIPLGALAVLADLAFGTCYGSTLPPGGGFTTAELSLTRVQETWPGGVLVGHGRVVHAGQSSVLTEARLYDPEGHLVAAGMSRLAVFPPPPELPAVPDPLPETERPTYDTPDPWQRDSPGGVLDEADWAGRSGMEILEAQVARELPPPPISRLTGLRVRVVGEGRAVVELPASPWLSTPAGTVQGGFTALIADTALACAIQTTLRRGDTFVPLDVKVNYLRPVMPDGRLLTATAKVTHEGRSLAVAHATVHNADGKPVALATGSAALTAAR
ncbi:MAG TPA: PaaI family thioesterase [Acidimicrobiales bacterium]|nr:PaaI family thioesterase [Acidimicrobiales bacterium]